MLILFSVYITLRIFAGIRTWIYIVFSMITENNGFIGYLLITINMINFDDDFILRVTPHWLLRFARFDIPKIKVLESEWPTVITLIPVILVVL